MSIVNCKVANRFTFMKVICAFMIVLIHTKPSNIPWGGSTWWVTWFLNEGVCRIAVPFFFLAAGYFWVGHYNPEGGGWRIAELKKRFWSLVMPLLVWSTVACGILATLMLIGMETPVASAKEWMTFIGLNPYATPWYGQLWFVRALIIIVVGFSLVPDCVFRNRVLMLLAVSLLGVICFIGRPFVGFGPWAMSYTVSLEGAFYFSIGIFLRLHPLNLRVTKVMSLALIALALALFVLRTHFLQNNEKALAAYIGFAASPMLIAGLFFGLPSFEVPKWLAVATFPCFILHRFILMALGASQRVNTSYVLGDSIALYFGCAIFAFALSIGIATIMSRCFPKANAFVFGNRVKAVKV